MKYIIQQFKAAYGENTEKAFKVCVQNFSGTGNSCYGIVSILGDKDIAEDQDLMQLAPSFIEKAERNIITSMDNMYNLQYNVTFSMDRERYKDWFADQLYCPKNEPVSENSTNYGCNKWIPAVINEAMDQRDQKGKPSFMLSY